LNASEDGLLYGILSQSDVVNFLASNTTKLDLKGDPPLRSRTSQLYRDNVITVHSNQNCLDAFSTLYLHRILGVAVVDDDYKLIGNLSASDFRGALTEDFAEFLKKPVSHLLRLQKRRIVSCLPSARLSEILSLLKNEKVHRVYIVDDSDRPVGILSLTEIIQILRPTDYKETPNYIL